MDVDLLFRPATDLGALIRGGELSARELTEAALERIEALQPDLNAFVHLDPDGALAAAEAVGPGDERPFAGVPIAVKDTAPVAGMPFRLGSDAFGDFVAPHDAFVVRRLRDAGFVIVGKTNLPEFGILPVTGPDGIGGGQGALGVDVHERVELAVEGLDAIEAALDQLARAELPTAN